MSTFTLKEMVRFTTVWVASVILLSFSSATFADASSYVIPKNSRVIAFSPDNSHILLYVSPDTPYFSEEYYSLDTRSGLLIRLLKATGSSHVTVKITPDSRYIIYSRVVIGGDASAPPGLFRMPIGGGEVETLYDQRVDDFDMTPDSSQVVFVGHNLNESFERLFRVPVSGGDVSLLT